MTAVLTATGLARLTSILRAEVLAGRPFGFDTEWDAPRVVHRGKLRPDGLRADIVGWSVAVAGRSEGWYVPRRHAGWVAPPGFAAAERRLLGGFVGDARARVVAHNWKGELHALRGVPVGCRLLDSEILTWLAGWRLSGKQGLKLKAQAEVRLGYRGPSFETLAAGRQASELTVAEIAPYAAQDAVLTLALYNAARERCLDLGLMGDDSQWELDQACIPAVAEMEATGVTLDAAGLEADAGRCESELRQLEGAFTALTETTVSLPTKVRVPVQCPATHAHDAACQTPGCVSGFLYYKNGKPRMRTELRPLPTACGAHPGNDAQVSRWLFDELRWWPRDGHPTTSNGFSVAAEDIRPYTSLPGRAGEAARMRLRYQALRKYATTYTRSLVSLAAQAGDGLLHSTFRQDGTDTQRFSSSGPNLQNLPSSERQALPWMDGLPDIRARFLARPGCVLVIRDFSQVELRIVAHYSRDPALLAAYRNPGTDAHQLTMDRIGSGITRRAAKVVNFSTIYRISAPRLAVKVAMATNDWGVTVRDAQRWIDGYFESYPGVRGMHEELIELAHARGYAATLTGFKRPLTAWSGRARWGTENQAINTPIQGTAGGLIKRAMVQLHRQWREHHVPARLVAQVHDELIVECPPEWAGRVNAGMEAVMAGCAPDLAVPMVSSGGVGGSWAAAKQ